MIRYVLLFPLFAHSAVAQPALPPLELRVAKDGWGAASSGDVKAVCASAAKELWKHFPADRKFDPITVTFSKQGPMVIYGKGTDGDRRVLLNAQDSFWSQYAYQFAHEFCHIACNYRESEKSNHWFEESLCETASLFALKQMSESWKMQPPYSNWKDYSKSLKSYVDDHMKKFDTLGDFTLAEWYQRNEAALRKNSTDRPKNQVVAVQLLPLFEKSPEHWAAVGYLNQWEKTRTLSWKEYLADWHQRVPEKHKKFVAEVGGLFKVNLE